MEREISIILKVRGAKAAKKAVNDVFDGKTKTLVDGFNKSTKKTGDNMQRVNKTSKNAGKSMGSFTKVLGRGMAALYLYNRAWMTFGRNFEQGLQLERASTQFERHVGNVTKMLPELKVATRGVIADFDLLKTANRAFQQGIQPARMSRAFGLATSAAQKLGLQAKDAINTITNAITKQDEGALNTLGIITNVNQAYKTQTALISKNGGVMSKAMSIQLRQSLIMKELEKRFGGANKAQLDGLMVLERFKASWKNFRAEIGQTLGSALIPLTRALTGVLDVTTALLDKLNDTSGFKKFIQLSVTLAGVWGGIKFINGARTLMSLLGMLSGSRGLKVPKMLKTTTVMMGKFGKVVSGKIPILARFSGWLTRVLGLGASFARIIPGWGAAIAAVTLLMDPLIWTFKKVWTAGKVFFQLLGNFDENSGLSRVLKKDAEELGFFYNWVESAAKISLEFGAVIRGVSQGISEAFAPVGEVIDWVGTQLKSFGIDLEGTGRIAARQTSRIDAIADRWKRWAKYIGLAASAIALFVPGLQAAGAVGVSVFGGSVLNDMGAGQALSDAMSPSQGSSPSYSGRMAYAVGQEPQTSTQRETPSARPMNLDYNEDQRELNKKMLKILEKQTTIMETDSQKQEIRESQQNARGNIFRR